MSSSVHPVDVSILVLFFIVTLIVGMRYGRQVKTIREYAVGDKNFTTPVLTATIIATWFGGGALVRGLEKTYSLGLYYNLSLVGIAVGLLLSGHLVSRMREFMNNVSVAEAMGDMYGSKAQMLTAASGALAKLGAVAIQFKVMSRMLVIIFNYDSTAATIIAAGITILYSSFGGIKAVTFTDVIQFFTFGALMPVLGLVIWKNLQTPNQVIDTLKNNPNFDIKEVVSWNPQLLSTISLFLYFAIPAFSPELFQRITMAKNVTQARASLTYAAGTALLIVALISWIGILILADNPGLEPSQVFGYMIDTYTYPGLTGLIGIGVSALAMSTADSMLNASSILFANDIVKPLTGQRASSIQVARLFSVIGGIWALVLSLYSNDLLALLLLSGSFYMPIFAMPMLWAVLGFRTSTKGVLLSMAAGFITVILWSIFLTNAGSIVPGMLANLIVLLGSHYLLGEPGGWQQVAPDSPLGLERAARKKAWKKRIEAVRKFRLYAYLQQNLPTQEGLYSLFGFYAIAATYTACYTIGIPNIKTYQEIYEGIFHTVFFATTTFLTFPIWPSAVKSQRFITFFWPIGMAAILFFAGMLLAILSHFQTLQVMILMVNFLIAVLLLRWPLVLTLAIIGMGAAVLFFKQYTGAGVLPSDGINSTQLKIMYGVLLFTSFLIALFKGKHSYRKLESHNEQLRAERAASSEELVAALHHRERLAQEVSMGQVETLATIHKMQHQLDDKLKQTQTQEQLVAVKKDLQATTGKLQVLTDYLTQVIYQTQDYLSLEVSTVALEALLQMLFEVLDKQDTTLPEQVLPIRQSTCEELQADVGKLRRLLIDSLHYAHQHKKEFQPILLGIADTTLGYPINSIPGHVKEVEALGLTITTAKRLPVLRTLYMGSVDRSSIRLPQSAAELSITHNQQIVDAHYGTSELLENEEGVTQVYVIPVRVREVRPKMMELFSQEDVALDTTVYPEETAFVKAVSTKTDIDMGLVEKAIQLVKKYHAGVSRKSGGPFYLHPIAVAHILWAYTQDQDTILAALLHDTVENTRLSLPQVALVFNPAVKKIVDGVTHLDSNLKSLKRIQLSAHENIQQLLAIDDERILYVKLSDRLHNMRTIEGHDSLAKRQKIAEETLQCFVPIARQLGLKPIEEELQKLSWAVLSKKK